MYKMERKTYIVLHKNEWDRLHRKKNDSHEKFDERDAYFRRLVEISQRWIETWPDTVQGHVEQVKKQKQKHHLEEIELVKTFFKNRTQEGTKEAVKKAKQLIFEDSCYGKQLTSALLESKTLEERNLQIEFQKELKQRSQAEEKEALSKLNLSGCTFDLDKKEDESNRKKWEKEVELAKINKSIYEMELCKKHREKKEQERIDLDNALLMQELLEKEAKQEKEYEKQIRKDIALYERDQKLARERKAKREKIEQELADAQRKELERKYIKISNVLKDMHHDRQSTDQYRQNYELVKKNQEKEQKRYNEFVQKGINDMEHGTTIEDQDEASKQKSDQETRHIISNINKAEAERAEKCKIALKAFKCSFCDRQSLLPKSNHRKKSAFRAIEEKQPTNFLVPTKKLQEQLVVRRNTPSPWSGLDAAHAHFALEAGQVLQEAKYKHFARKVVDNYRKTNLLDATTLPVANYN